MTVGNTEGSRNVRSHTICLSMNQDIKKALGRVGPNDSSNVTERMSVRPCYSSTRGSIQCGDHRLPTFAVNKKSAEYRR